MAALSWNFEELQGAANCITVIPVLNEWTQYAVTDLNATVPVAARRTDVRVEQGMNHQRASGQPQTSYDVTVHEGKQGNYAEAEACRPPARPTAAGSSLSPKWIAAGAGGRLDLRLRCGDSGGGNHHFAR
jgi:hypothetical protein